MPPAASGALASLLRDYGQIELVGVDEVAVRAGRGVGTCSGGPVRFLLGGLENPYIIGPATLAVKLCLLLLPALCAVQWGLRCVKLMQRLRKEGTRQGAEKR